MRLFIATAFDKEVMDSLLKTRDEIVGMSDSLSLPNPRNYHLTLAFLGECSNSDVLTLRKIIDSTPFKKTDIEIGDLGYFESRHGKTLFREVKVPDSFPASVMKLRERILEAGLPCDNNNPYYPHVTLARNAFPKKGMDFSSIECEMIHTTLDSVLLLKSIFNETGPNTYMPLYERKLS